MDAKLRQAVGADVPQLVTFMHGLYAADEVPPDEQAWIVALRGLMADERYGRAWVILGDDQVAGYVVVTFGYSLEFYGRDAFVDELYLAEGYRGQGLGRQTLQWLESYLRSQGIGALHLEVEEDNRQAQRLYQSWGFCYRRHMHLMSKRLT